MRWSPCFETRAHCLHRSVIGYPNELQINLELNPTNAWDLDGELFLWTLPRFNLVDFILNLDLDLGTSTVIHRLRLNRYLSWLAIAINSLPEASHTNRCWQSVPNCLSYKIKPNGGENNFCSSLIHFLGLSDFVSCDAIIMQITLLDEYYLARKQCN